MNTFKRFAVALTAVTMLSTAAVAETFFSKSSGDFVTEGYTKGADGNPVCQANVKFTDGGYISIVKDLVDDELWMEIHDPEWNADQKDINTKIEIHWSFHKNDGTPVVWQSAWFRIATPSTIQLRMMNGPKNDRGTLGTFIDLFQSAAAMSFEYRWKDDHDIERSESLFSFKLNGSRDALDNVMVCKSGWDFLQSVKKKPLY